MAQARHPQTTHEHEVGVSGRQKVTLTVKVSLELTVLGKNSQILKFAQYIILIAFKKKKKFFLNKCTPITNCGSETLLQYFYCTYHGTVSG